jgi:alkylated DNA repair protein (DNA oxidative demethylase)
MVRLAVAPGVSLWRGYFPPPAQKLLLDQVLARLQAAPLYRPTMPVSGKPFSVEESNFGSLGWVSDKAGYRYQETHPVTGRPWPDIPPPLLALWEALAELPPPQCCLVNLYRQGARMGQHQDRDENDVSAPVIGVSMGDSALFRIGGTSRRAASNAITLTCGDVLMFGGEARLAYHGIDRVMAGTSRLVPGGGRLSLTLRRVVDKGPCK